MSLDNPVLRSRKPTQAIPYPFILVEGEEGAGKSWSAAVLSASERVGPTYWLELGEVTADQYGAVPGARFEVLEHDGTYAQVLEQVLAVRDVARKAHEAGEPPVVLVIDTMGNVWDGLKDWVSQRAREKPANQRKLAADPAAELDVSRNLWNDAGNRYRRLTTVLLTFPGIVVGIAKGGEVSDTDPSTGQPFKDGRKKWRIEGEKNLRYDATVIVRMTRGNPPLITKCKSVHAGHRPEDPPVAVAAGHDNLLDWLTFDVLKADPHADPARYVSMVGGDLLPEEQGAEDEENGRAAPRTQQRQEPAKPDPAELEKQVREWVTNLNAQTYANEFLLNVLEQAKANGFHEHQVDGVTIASEVERLVQANAVPAQASETPQAGQNGPQAAQDTLPTANEPPEPDQGPQNAEQPPVDDQVREQIAEARAEAQAAVNNPPPAGPPGLTAEDLAIVILEESDESILRQAWEDAKANDLLEVNVLEYLDDDDRATLGVPPHVDFVKLGGLVFEVNKYVKRHGNAVRHVPEPSADPWAVDQLQPGEEPPPGWL